MGKLASIFGAATLAVSFAVSSFAPANAAPQFAPRVPVETRSDIINVQNGGRDVRDHRRFNRGGERWRNGGWRRGDSRYWRGHRGSRHWRQGYRRHNGWWYPAGAFFAGAIIGSAISGPRYYEPPRRYRSASSAHVRWCYNRYRSYRAWDNTYQPYNGPRRECYSPYRY